MGLSAFELSNRRSGRRAEETGKRFFINRLKMPSSNQRLECGFLRANWISCRYFGFGSAVAAQRNYANTANL